MSFSYSGDPASSDLDEVRFLIADTDEADALFQDAEIKYAIAKWTPLYGSNLYTAAVLLDTAAAQYAQQASYSADGVSVTMGAVGDQLRAMAASLRAQYEAQAAAGVAIEAGGMNVGEGKIPGTRDFMFGIGMDDDPEAGRQDWGSYRDDWERRG